MWPNQPLGRSITGNDKTLDHIQREHLLTYLKSHYVAPATVIAAAGNIQHDKVVKAVKKMARRFVSGHRRQYSPATSAQTAPVVKLYTKKTEQTQIAFGIRACSRHDPQRFALRVLNAVLGENMSSRLFQTVREDQGLAYSIYSANSFFDDAGDLVISSGLETANLGKLMKTVLREMKRLRENLVPMGELRRAREYLVGQLDLSMENSENQMMWLAEQWLGYGKIWAPEEVKKRLSAVKPSEVRAAARAFFRPERYNLALVSPLKSVEKMLPRFTI
jgi:predicted Zn-dependent peptidase